MLPHLPVGCNLNVCEPFAVTLLDAEGEVLGSMVCIAQIAIRLSHVQQGL